MRFGRHIKLGSGPALADSLYRERDAGLKASQVFLGSPQTYRVRSSLPRLQLEDFSIVVHGSFLVNLASGRDKDLDCVKSTMEASAKIGAEYVVFHAGSSKDDPHRTVLPAYWKSLRDLSDYLNLGPTLLLENTAQGRPFGTKGSLGALSSLARILKDSYPTVKLCLDTAHAWACGEDIEFLTSTPNLGRLFPVVHLNNPDPGVFFGSRRDRHSGFLDKGEMELSSLYSIVRNISPEVVIFEAKVHEPFHVLSHQSKLCL